MVSRVKGRSYRELLSQSFDPVGVQVYMGYRQYRVRVRPQDLDAAHVFILGAVMNFDLSWNF